MTISVNSVLARVLVVILSICHDRSKHCNFWTCALSATKTIKPKVGRADKPVQLLECTSQHDLIQLFQQITNDMAPSKYHGDHGLPGMHGFLKLIN